MVAPLLQTDKGISNGVIGCNQINWAEAGPHYPDDAHTYAYIAMFQQHDFRISINDMRQF